MVEQARDWLRASGAKRIHPVRLIYPKWPSGGQHQAGTCRMGLDPRTSVTDSWGRVWGTRGGHYRRRLTPCHQWRRESSADNPGALNEGQRALGGGAWVSLVKS